MIYLFATFTILLAAASLLWIYFLIPAILMVLPTLYFMYARYLFSPRGGDVQTKVRRLLLDQIHWDGTGTVLDIGCGSGALAIAIATKYPQATIIGIDSWGAQWEYSQRRCETNAQLAGFQHRISFQKASASALPFPDAAFDLVVSNLVFHEVHDVKDKRILINEALRVLKKNGVFVFQDLFLLNKVYGDTDNLINAVKKSGIDTVEFLPTRDAPDIPRALKLPFMIGTIGILKGRK